MPLQERVIDTGIVRVVDLSSNGDKRELIREMVKLVREWNDLAGQLRKMRDEALAIRADHCPGAPVTAQSDSMAPIAQDAGYMLYEMEQLGDFELLSEDELGLLWRGITIGCMQERMRVRPFEPHALRGRRQLDAASRGGKARAVRGPSDEAIARAKAEHDEFRKRNPALSASAALRHVSERHGVPVYTLRRRFALKKV